MPDPSAPQAPANDEVEVNLFGPGVGESIIVHVGDNQWVIIDSCVEGRTGTNPAVEYLEQIEIDIATAVVLVVATHAHDDHVEGMHDIVKLAEAAAFVVPAAATEVEFFSLLSLDEENELLDVRPAAYAEYRQINDTLSNRAKGRGKYPAYTLAIAGRPVWSRPASADSPGVTVESLTPSDEAVQRSREWLGAQLVDGARRKRTTPDDPNTFGVVLRIAVGDVEMLFGADLMTGPGPNCGWNAVVAGQVSGANQASLYKVAHHGSDKSDHPGIWSKLLTPGPLALLTPYRPSGLPRVSDIARIKSLAATTAITASVTAPAKPARVRRAAAELSGVATSVQERKGLTGQVRARRPIHGTSWEVVTWPPASVL